MSFDVFLQCFDRGEPSGVSADAVRAVFTNFEKDSEPDYWHLRYAADDHCHISVSRPEGRPSEIEALTVLRPCGDRRFWASLFRVLELGQWVLYFPADSPPLVVANVSNAEHLPEDMRESLGPVTVVHSGDDILRVIRPSWPAAIRHAEEPAAAVDGPASRR